MILAEEYFANENDLFLERSGGQQERNPRGGTGCVPPIAGGAGRPKRGGSICQLTEPWRARKRLAVVRGPLRIPVLRRAQAAAKIE